MPSTRNNDTATQFTKAAGDASGAATQNAQRFTDQVTQIFGLAGERGEELTRRSTQNLEAMTQASTAVARGFQDLSREWFSLVQETTQKNIEGITALARCRTLPELLSVQAELVRTSMQQTVDGTRRMAEVSSRVMTDASQTAVAQANSTRQAA
jgi:phasin family protein